MNLQINLNPQEIHGNWRAGYALDFHTVSSRLLPDGRFDTEYTGIGKMVNQVKYYRDRSKIRPLAEIVAKFVKEEFAVDGHEVVRFSAIEDQLRQIMKERCVKTISGAIYRDDFLQGGTLTDIDEWYNRFKEYIDQQLSKLKTGGEARRPSNASEQQWQNMPKERRKKIYNEYVDKLFQTRNDLDYVLSQSPARRRILKGLQGRLPDIDAIVPMLPSETNRPFQPVRKIAAQIGSLLNLSARTDYLIKVKQTPCLKDLPDIESKQAAIQGAFVVPSQDLRGRCILLFDDIYDSGTTLTEATNVLYEQGRVGHVLVLTLTQTRMRR